MIYSQNIKTGVRKTITNKAVVTSTTTLFESLTKDGLPSTKGLILQLAKVRPTSLLPAPDKTITSGLIVDTNF